MKKVVFKLDIDDDKAKQKVTKAVSRISGVDSISMDMKDKKLTVIGDIDPVNVTHKLSKLCVTEIVSVGPAKEEKKEEPPKKDEGMKTDEKKLGEALEHWKAYQAYNPNTSMYYVVESPPKPKCAFQCVIS